MGGGGVDRWLAGLECHKVFKGKDTAAEAPHDNSAALGMNFMQHLAEQCMNVNSLDMLSRFPSDVEEEKC